jgi:hypothetical protein
MVMHKNVHQELYGNFLSISGLTLQVIDIPGLIFCLLNEHFVETRIAKGLRGVKRGLSTKLCTITVDILKTSLETAT